MLTQVVALYLPVCVTFDPEDGGSIFLQNFYQTTQYCISKDFIRATYWKPFEQSTWLYDGKISSTVHCCRSVLATGYSSHSRPPSVREQLAAAGGATVVVVPSPQPGCPRSLFGRLGIRKPSLLSLTSPHGHHHHQTSASATARTFSLDDLLKPPSRSKISLKPPVFFFFSKKRNRTKAEANWRPLCSYWISVAICQCCW